MKHPFSKRPKGMQAAVAPVVATLRGPDGAFLVHPTSVTVERSDKSKFSVWVEQEIAHWLNTGELKYSL